MPNIYSLFDFTESLQRANIPAEHIEVVIGAHGTDEDGWEGGFVMKMRGGGYAYLAGWCDIFGWGSQDGADIIHADTLPELGLSPDLKLQPYPIDLNNWIKDAERKGAYD